MLRHLGNYSPVAEGRFYVRWHQMNVAAGDRARSYRPPYFLLSKEIQELISLEAHLPFTELVRVDELPAFTAAAAALLPLEKQELEEKAELNRRIFLRIVANAAKTVTSINFLTGLEGRTEAERRTWEFIDGLCEACGTRERREFRAVAKAYVDELRETVAYRSTGAVTESFCQNLRANDYHWNVDRLKPTPDELLLDRGGAL